MPHLLASAWAWMLASAVSPADRSWHDRGGVPSHLIAMNLKARHEESHLEESFGPAYTEYCSKVGRFWLRPGRDALHRYT